MSESEVGDVNHEDLFGSNERSPPTTSQKIFSKGMKVASSTALYHQEPIYSVELKIIERHAGRKPRIDSPSCYA